MVRRTGTSRAEDMGMTRRRCPRCNRVRRRAERSKTARPRRWEFIDGQLICHACVGNAHVMQTGSRAARIADGGRQSGIVGSEPDPSGG
jgi:hypothetical protein